MTALFYNLSPGLFERSHWWALLTGRNKEAQRGRRLIEDTQLGGDLSLPSLLLKGLVS